METIYLDTCALNRFTDDLSQARIYAEAVAIEQILALVKADSVRWVTSAAVRLEVSRNPDEERREQTLPLLDFAQNEIVPTPDFYEAARVWQKEGFGALDALHLAVSAAVNVDYLITVDDRLVRRAARLGFDLKPNVINPVNWIARRVV